MTTDLRRALNEKPAALIGHPQPVDKSRAAVIIGQRCRNNTQNVIIITTDKKCATETLNSSSFIKDNIEICDYSQGNKLLQTYNNLLVFDSLSDIYELIPNGYKNGFEVLPTLIKNRNVVIILVTFGITEDTLTRFRNVIPGAYFLWTTFLERPFKIEYYNHISTMTPQQEIVYTVARTKEIENNREDTTYMFSERYCNISLPIEVAPLIDTNDEPSVEDMMAKYWIRNPSYSSVNEEIKRTNKKKNVTIIGGKRNSNIIEEEIECFDIVRSGDINQINSLMIKEKVRPPVKTEREILSEKYFFDKDTFLENSPKINDLITQIILYQDMRHVIYTRYNKHHGVRMLVLLFKYLGFNVYGCHIDMDKKDQMRMINEFNKDLKPGIFVTSQVLPPDYNLYNISHLHLLDSGFSTSSSLMDAIFKYRLYKSLPCEIMIHNYVSKRRISETDRLKQPSADEVLFKQFVTKQQEDIQVWDSIQNKGYPIVIGKDGYLHLMSS